MGRFGRINGDGKYHLIMPSSQKDKDTLLELMDSIILLFHTLFFV